MSDQKPRVQWNRCGDCDPGEEGYKLTIDEKGRLVEHYHTRGEWRLSPHDTMNPCSPSSWAAVIDEVPSGDPPFEFDWVKSSDRLPPNGDGGTVRVVWTNSSVLRIASFDGFRWWISDGDDVGAPDWWAPARRDGRIPVVVCPTVSDFNMRQGRTCFAGTSVTVDHLFNHLAAGCSIEGFLEGYPHVKREQVTATLRKAGAVMVARGHERKRFMRWRRKRWAKERELGVVLGIDDPLPEPHDVPRPPTRTPAR